jgi:hypothetical protein
MDTIANAATLRESKCIRETKMAITMRPNENKIVTLDKKRQKYGLYDVSDQKKILENIIYHCELKGLKFTDINYETTQLKGKMEGKDMIHFHCFFNYFDDASYYALKEHAILLNSRYGVPTYTAFDYQFLFNDQEVNNWKQYIKKDHKHSVGEWTAGI